MKKLKINSSALIKSSCDLRLKRIVVDGYAEKLPYNDTLYGSAYHLFQAEMYRTKGDFSVATLKALEFFSQPCEIRPFKKHLTPEHLTKTCHDSWLYYYPKDTFQVLSYDDGKPMVEITFENKDYLIYRDYSVDLVGTIDKFGKILQGIYSIGDYKVHSLFSITRKAKEKGDPDIWIKKEIEEYFKQYELSLQFSFYLFNLKLKALQNPDSEFARICQTPLGYFIDGVFISSTEKTKFARSTIYIPKLEFYDLFDKMLKRLLKRFIDVLVDNPDYSDPDGLLHGVCNEGRFPCAFSTICARNDPLATKFLLEENFIQREYDPLDITR